MQKILAALMSVVFLLLTLSVTTFAEGDANMDGGGGDLMNGTSSNFWNPEDEGVRVTIIKIETGKAVKTPIDISNVKPTIKYHFGKISKIDYINGKALQIVTSDYYCSGMATPLPTIISDGGNSNIDEIKRYFCSEYTLMTIADKVGMEYTTLINGNFKLLIEPIAYFTFNGVKVAMTATEAALYDQQLSHGLYNKMWPLTHMNLPLSIFLEEGDLGFSAWIGSDTARASNENIIKYLGVGVVHFSEEPTPPEVEIVGGDCEYRVDTDVITSVKVTGGRHSPDNPVTVKFLIGTTQYVVNNVVYPESETQLVWVKWHTPKTKKTVPITVTVIGDGVSTDHTSFNAKIVSLDENVPPNPTADDRNDAFKAVALTMGTDVDSLSWGVWSCYWSLKYVWHSNWTHHYTYGWVKGKYVVVKEFWRDDGKYIDEGEWKYNYKSYTVTLDVTAKITPDEHCPTATETTLGAGYGFTETVTTKLKTNFSAATTEAQTAIAYFPEFSYKKYWRLLEQTKGGMNAIFEFQKNKYSTYNSRVHFTPLWLKDQTYNVYTVIMDVWTPAGMLKVHRDWALLIRGCVWDDWVVVAKN